MRVNFGSAGAIALSLDGSLVHVSASSLWAIDTTSAGDAFVDRFAFGPASGADLDAAVRSACALATNSVWRRGTQESFPSAIEAARIVHSQAEPRP